MSKSSAQEPKVITFGELFMLVTLTVALMILLFPKNMIDKAIEEEKSNYDLTLIYLKSIAEAYPDNPKNFERLLDAQLKIGNTAAAEEIFQRLETLTPLSQKERALWHYRLLKERYFRTKDLQKEKLRTMLARQLAAFVNSDTPSQWYFVMQETKTLQMPRLHFKALQKYLLHTDLISEEELKHFLDLAAQHSAEQTDRIFDHLAAIDLTEQMQQAIENHFLATSAYGAAARFFERRFRHRHDAGMLLKSMRYYFWANKPRKARSLLQAHKALLLAHDQTARALITLLLENNQLETARSITLELLKKRKVLP